ncbi:FAD-dependent monooxygenase [Streptomyces sp. NPDC056716]|uniref:FAD-dependent monooxygenase n=1 Tax=unclassified Streptomyces TaxID=2593676 RepID=UPI00367B7FD9
MSDATTTTDTAPRTDGASAYVPVLISGAGPVGLILSILLSRAGVRNVVVEKRERIGELPRSRGVTVRTMELLDQIGLREELESTALPYAWTRQFVYTETLAGKIVGTMATDATSTTDAAALSPAHYVVAAQDRIDPMLFKAAIGYPEAEVRMGTEVIEYTEDADGVVTTVVNPNGTLTRLRSAYIVAADGARSPLREMAGITETGRTTLRTYINNYVRADLSRFTAGREGSLIWTFAPGREGLFQPLDGVDRWAVQVQREGDPSVVGRWTEEEALAHIRAMIGDPAADETEIDIIRSYGFALTMTISDQFRKGRLLLTGDAAHQVPPFGGFGLNTGIQSAHNLAWKLVEVLRGTASEELLDTYQTERHEVGRRVMDFARTNSGYIEQLMRSVGQGSDEEKRSAIIGASRQYGNWWGLDLGVHYEEAGAFIPDDVPAPYVENPVIDYVPHAKPGYRAPHFWAALDGDRVSSIALCDGDFVVFTGPDGQPWTEAARALPLDNTPAITAYRVAADGDLVPETDFCKLYGIQPDGAVLIRPDGHVAYRAEGLPADPTGELTSVLLRILGRTA